MTTRPRAAARRLHHAAPPVTPARLAPAPLVPAPLAPARLVRAVLLLAFVLAVTGSPVFSAPPPTPAGPGAGAAAPGSPATAAVKPAAASAPATLAIVEKIAVPSPGTYTRWKFETGKKVKLRVVDGKVAQRWEFPLQPATRFSFAGMVHLTALMNGLSGVHPLTALLKGYRRETLNLGMQRWYDQNLAKLNQEMADLVMGVVPTVMADLGLDLVVSTDHVVAGTLPAVSLFVAREVWPQDGAPPERPVKPAALKLAVVDAELLVKASPMTLAAARTLETTGTRAGAARNLAESQGMPRIGEALEAIRTAKGLTAILDRRFRLHQVPSPWMPDPYHPSPALEALPDLTNEVLNVLAGEALKLHSAGELLHTAAGLIVHAPAVKALLAAGVPPDAAPPAPAEPPLVTALRAGNDHVATALVQGGATARGTVGELALGLAMDAGHPDMVGHLLKAGAPATAVSRHHGITLLHFGAGRTDLSLVERALAAGVSVDAQQKNGATALSIVSGMGGKAAQVRKLLLERGARADLPPDGPMSTTAQLMKTNSMDAAFVLQMVRRGAPVTVRDADGSTLLHKAVLWNCEELATEVLKRGVPVDAKTLAGETPLRMATRMRVDGLAALLRKAGAEPVQ